MNIAIVARELNRITGTPIHIQMLCRYLCQRGHEVHLITMCEIHEDLDFSVCHVHRAEDEPGLSPFEKTRRLADTVLTISNQYSIEVIHAHYTHAIMAGVLNKIYNGPPVVVTLHGGEILMLETPWKYRLLRIGIQESDLVIAVSKACLSQTKKMLGIEPHSSRIIPDAIDPQMFQIKTDRDEIRESIQISPEAILGVFVGRLTAIKGVNLLVKAAGEILQRYEHCSFLFIGDGDLKLSLQQEAKKQGHQKRLQFIGYQPHVYVPSYLDAADFVVVPSLWEACGTIVLEALAAGKPIIASNAGGIPEIIQHRKNGLLFQRDDCQNLITTISDFLEADSSFLKMLSTNALKTASDFTYSKMTQKIEEAYQEAIRLHSQRVQEINPSTSAFFSDVCGV